MHQSQLGTNAKVVKAYCQFIINIGIGFSFLSNNSNFDQTCIYNDKISS